MSLPKEPRQKMINIMYLVLTALLALNVSSEILNAFRTVNRSLENTNTAVNESTATIMKSLKDKTLKEETKERALIWYPKAEQATTVSQKLYDYIGNLKTTIFTRAGGKVGDPTAHWKEDNLDIVTRLMIKDGEGKKLKKMLEDYNNEIKGIDTAIAANFPVPFVDVSPPPGRDKKVRAWEVSYFHMVPTIAGLTILSKFQNDIKTAENKVVAFCHNKVGEVEVVFDAYAAIVGQNSTYLMPGQNLEIKAGIGAFSKAARPTITINGQSTTLLDSGFVRQSLDAGSLGPHSVPVVIRYKNQVTGKDEVINYDVKYMVGTSNTSIALTDMNVLYSGWPNRVNITASGAGDEKVNASISAGSITKQGGGNYIAQVPAGVQEVTISISADGRAMGSQKFRVRRIPDPVATVGGVMSNENMPAGQFKAQGGVGAFIKDFPLDLKYTVTSFTLTADDENGDIQEAPCQGNTWSPKALSIIRGLTANRTVTVDNIRVQCPDGQNRKIPGLTYYIK